MGAHCWKAHVGRSIYRLLSDDLCTIEMQEGHQLKILPAFPRVKLWRDSARQLHLPAAPHNLTRPAA